MSSPRLTSDAITPLGWRLRQMRQLTRADQLDQDVPLLFLRTTTFPASPMQTSSGWIETSGRHRTTGRVRTWIPWGLLLSFDAGTYGAGRRASAPARQGGSQPSAQSGEV